MVLNYIWIGFFLIMVGLIITFFSSYKQIWARIRPDKDGTRIDIAFKSSRNPVGMEREISQMVANLTSID